MILPAATFDPFAHAGHPRRARDLVYGVPTMFIARIRIIRSFERFDFSSLRSGVMAGAPCPIEVMKRVVIRCIAGK